MCVLARTSKLSIEQTTMAILPWLMPLIASPAGNHPLSRIDAGIAAPYGLSSIAASPC
jgi:hypothetical protein